MDAETALPSAPLNLAASVVNDVLSVTWDAPATGAPILAYVLQVAGRASGGGVSIPHHDHVVRHAHTQRPRAQPHVCGERGERRGAGPGQCHRRRRHGVADACRARR